MAKIKDSIKVKGVITLRAYKAGTNILLKEIVQPNTIMLSSSRGLDLLVQRLIGNAGYTTIINYGGIGTSSTAATTADTQLGAESARTTVALGTDLTYNQAVIQFFFADVNLANTTYYEFGTFVDGTATANSGQLFNRAIFGTPYTKAAGTDVTVQVTISFS